MKEVHSKIQGQLRRKREEIFTLFNFEVLVNFANLVGGVAQLGEHLPCKQGVDSSILFTSTKWAHSSGG